VVVAPPPPPPAGGGEEPGELPPLNNPATIVEPVNETEEDEEELEETENDVEFGVDFPRLIEADILTEEQTVNEPVTSGGDSALYSSPVVEPSNATTEGEE